MKNITTLEELIPDESSKLGQYEKILDETLQNDKLLNIALTGSYGAGKSSVIRAYNYKHKDKKFIYVTLTAFQKNAEVPKGKDTNEGIAGKIINQLVHQMKTSDIPQTKFHVKELIHPSKVIKYTAAVLGLIISGLYGIKYWGIRNIAEKLDIDILWFLCGKIGIGVMATIFLASLGVLTYSIIKRQLMHPFIAGLKIKGNEVPIKNPEEDENFDKYLDEIIYLFQKSSVDAIVFEDIDRFNDNSIYVKLREMNYLINERENVYWSEKRIQRNKKKNQKRRVKKGTEAVLKKETNKVRFIYLLRDDLFAAEDRTKFFDLIIPIIPITDSSNAYEQMHTIFNKHGIELKEEQKQFLKRIMPYFNEQRLIKNIYNEFSIYNTQLGREEQNLEISWERLFGYISYKNTYPEDFADLQQGRGFAWTIISKKDFAIEFKRRELNKEIEDISRKDQENMVRLQGEREHREEELLVELFPVGQYELIPNVKNYSQQSQPWKLWVKRILKEEKVNKVIWSPDNISLNPDTYQKTYVTQNVAELVDEIKKRPEYKAGMKEIQECLSREKELSSKRKILQLKEEIKNLSKLSLKDIYEKSALDTYLTEDEKKSFEGYINNPKTRLLAFLIRNGYMDESYHDYMTYFYPTECTLKDKNYMINLRSGEKREFNYSLDNPKLIIEDLQDKDYTMMGILNYDLLSYAVIKNNEKAKLIIEKAKKEKEFEFVYGYLLNGKKETKEKNCTRFIELLADNWVEYCSELWDTGDRDKLKEVLKIFLACGSDKIKVFNYQEVINKLISDDLDYLDLKIKDYDDKTKKRILEVFSDWKIEFAGFDSKVDLNTHQWILENGFFVPNKIMIEEYLKRVRKCELEENKLITQGMERDDILKKKMKENPKIYFEDILQTAEVIKEDESVLLWLFSKVDIGEDSFRFIFARWDGRIQNLERLNNKGWYWAVKYEKIENKTSNILRYFQSCGEQLSPELIQWINRLTDIAEGDEEKIKKIVKLKEKFCQAIICNKEIEPEKCIIILEALKIRFDKKFTLKNVPEQMMEMLMEHHIILMREGTYDDISNNYPNLIEFFIKNNLTIFYKLCVLTRREIYIKDAQKIINDNDVPEEMRRKLNKFVEDEGTWIK